ncbi:MAG: hypothetical protein IJC52_04195 [Clostridia bacterium]|nr:hypothetical protein [Clostridia bacterium]
MTSEDIKTLETALQSAKSAHRRIDRLEAEVGDLQKLTEAVAVTAANVSQLQQDIAEMKHDVKVLTDLPAKRWEAVIGYVMAALISGMIGAVLGMILR